MNDRKIWQTLQFSQASRGLEILIQAGIPCLLLKGAAGVSAGWLPPDSRTMTDVDVLIPPARLPEAVRLLGAQGWEPAVDPYLPLDARRHSREIRSPWGFLLDLHWFSLRHARWPGVDDVLWQGANRARLNGLEVFVPAPEAYLVHTVAHGRRKGSPGAPWRQDLRALLEHSGVELDWDKVVKIAANFRVAPLVVGALEGISSDAPACLPEGVCGELHRLPMSLRDRLFLTLTTHFGEEPGIMQALIVLLDFRRTRCARGAEIPAAFVDYLKDRWELASRGGVPARLAEVVLWGLQLEGRRLLASAGKCFPPEPGRSFRRKTG